MLPLMMMIVWMRAKICMLLPGGIHWWTSSVDKDSNSAIYKMEWNRLEIVDKDDNANLGMELLNE